MSLKLRLRSETWAVAISPSPARPNPNWLNAVEEIPSEMIRHRLNFEGTANPLRLLTRRHKPRLMMICQNGKCLTSKMNFIINTSPAKPWHWCHSFYWMLAYCLCWMETSSVLGAYAGSLTPALTMFDKLEHHVSKYKQFSKAKRRKEDFFRLSFQVRSDHEWRGVQTRRLLRIWWFSALKCEGCLHVRTLLLKSF